MTRRAAGWFSGDSRNGACGTERPPVGGFFSCPARSLSVTVTLYSTRKGDPLSPNEAYPVNSGELHNGPDKDWAAADGQETPWLRMDRRPCNCASVATASPLGRADGRLGVT